MARIIFAAGNAQWKKIMTAVLAVTILVLAIVIYKTVFKANDLFDFGPGLCDDAARNQGLTEFRSSINRFAMRERSAGVPNELYSPEDAIKEYKVYLACKQEGMYTDSELEQYGGEIDNIAKSAYINHAEDICHDLSEARQNNRDEEVDDLAEKYSSFAEEYYEFFDQEFIGESSC